MVIALLPIVQSWTTKKNNSSDEETSIVKESSNSNKSVSVRRNTSNLTLALDDDDDESDERMTCYYDVTTRTEEEEDFLEHQDDFFNNVEGDEDLEDEDDEIIVSVKTKSIITTGNFDDEKTIKKNQKKNDSDDDKRMKVVQFSTVTFYEHPIIVGDNPSVSYGGTPITIGWGTLSSSEYSIEKYETVRDEDYPRRYGSDLKLGAGKREALLLNLGFNQKERLKGTKIANVISNRRRSTVSNLHMCKVHEKLESITKRVLGKKRKERRYLKKHVPSYYNGSTVIWNNKK